MAVCVLAVDVYGDLSDSIVGDNDDDDERNAMVSSSQPFMLSGDFFEPTPSTKKTNGIAETKSNAVNSPENDSSSAVVRGDRTWREGDGESVSLCCGRCCSPLGYSSMGSPDTWRLWKHRLSAVMRQTDENNDGTMAVRNHRPIKLLHSTKPLGSCSSFLARELVRYAESKAIFTFVVLFEDCGRTGGKIKMNSQMEHNKCILLRLLSWETTMATSFEESSFQNPSQCNDDRRRSHELKFKRVAKIIFEETLDPTAEARLGHNNSSTQWFWGGVDLCCLPPSNEARNTLGIGNNRNTNLNTPSAEIHGTADSEGKVSTVRLQLPRQEYDQLLSDLIFGRSYFTKEIAEATIILKMGGLWKGLGLTAVTL